MREHPQRYSVSLQSTDYIPQRPHPSLMQVVACIGLLLYSLKLVYFIHPLVIVLLVIYNAQSPCLSLPLMMSMQGMLTTARNSGKLFVALNWSSSKTLNHQACPWLM